ncbi:FAD-binding domain-containing protein [Flagelloscypha sp. PMI_526]|nr:FAD-binding domain-containing protein [Flagelloscypha sp. PMI_526]
MLAVQLVLLAVASGVASKSTRADKWTILNSELGGRLHASLPLAAPCFSVVDGSNVTVDAAACAAVQSGYKSPLYRREKAPAYMLVQWERCQRTEENCLLDSSNPANPDPYSNGAECKQGSVSPYYLDITGPEDVQAAFKFAARTKTLLSIKNSGHDYKGRSSQRGSLNLWTRNLKSMTHTPNFTPEGASTTYPQTITIGAGVGFEDLYKFADGLNLTVIGGYHQTVGASGGWMMGGGHSVLSTVYGLGVDRVVQIKVVTPDGRYRVANSVQNKDLFWALRGGGGSTFGVVLESTIRVEPQIKLQIASLSFPINGTNYEGFLKIIVDESLKWAKEGWGGHMTHSSLINVTPLLTLDEAQVSLATAADYVRAQGGTVVIEELPSWWAFFEKYVTSVQAPVATEYIGPSRIVPVSLFETEEGKANLVSVLEKWVVDYKLRPYIINAAPYLYNSTEGPDATSVTPAWRNSLWQLAGSGIGWSWNATLETIRSKSAMATEAAALIHNIAPDSGTYQNECDVYEPDHEQSFWGSNYARLLSIKKR